MLSSMQYKRITLSDIVITNITFTLRTGAWIIICDTYRRSIVSKFHLNKDICNYKLFLNTFEWFYQRSQLGLVIGVLHMKYFNIWNSKWHRSKSSLCVNPSWTTWWIQIWYSRRPHHIRSTVIHKIRMLFIQLFSAPCIL